MRNNTLSYAGVLAISMLILVACGSQATPTPTEEAKQIEEKQDKPTEEVELVEEAVVLNAVSIVDQILGERNTFTIAAVTAAEPGWIAIHAQVDDSPGPILGLEPVSAGTHENLVVRIDIDDLTDVLYAMLYVDGGAPEIFEFPPSDDVPARDSEDVIIAPIFNRIPSTVEIGYNEELGAFLVGANGLTLYQFANDEKGESNCTDQCATAWPPLLVEEGEILSSGPDVDSELSTIQRKDGTVQVTYDDMPLYFYVGDENFGDANGHASGGVWSILKP